MTMPGIAYAFLVVVLIRLMELFKTFDLVFVMTRGGPGTVTDLVTYHIYRVAFEEYELGYASALSYFLLLILTPLFLFFFWALSRATSEAGPTRRRRLRWMLGRFSAAVGRVKARVWTEKESYRLQGDVRLKGSEALPSVKKRGRIGRPLRVCITYLLAALAGIFFLLPIVWMYVSSFKTSVDIANPAKLFAFFQPTIVNYQVAIETYGILQGLENSLIIAAGASILSVVIGYPAAYALARFNFESRERTAQSLLFGRILPPIVFVVPFFLLYSAIGAEDTYWGMILIYLTFGVSIAIWLLRDHIAKVPKELDESALVDGASHWDIMRLIFPITAPGVIAVLTFVFMLSYTELLYATILTGGAVRTVAIIAPSFLGMAQGGAGYEWGAAAATGVLDNPNLCHAVLIGKISCNGARLWRGQRMTGAHQVTTRLNLKLPIFS